MHDKTYVEEVPSVKSVAVQGDGLVAHEQVLELGDELLGVLMGLGLPRVMMRGRSKERE